MEFPKDQEQEQSKDIQTNHKRDEEREPTVQWPCEDLSFQVMYDGEAGGIRGCVSCQLPWAYSALALYARSQSQKTIYMRKGVSIHSNKDSMRAREIPGED